MRPRFHTRFPGALCENVAALGSGARLAAYRLEPVRTVDGPRTMLDLTFVHGAEVAVVAGIDVDRHALLHRDRSPFVAPRDAAGAGDALGDACDAVHDELAAAFAAQIDPSEVFCALPGIGGGAIAARRGADALGAAPYARVARARGAAVGDGAYFETCFAGAVPASAAASGGTVGAASAPLRCYVALADAALASGGAAYRVACEAAEALGGDDLAVDVGGYDGRPLDGYAFVHCVGLDDPHAAAELIRAANARGIRTLLTPLFDDVTADGFWGARTHARAFSLAGGGDEELLGRLQSLLARRGIELDDGVRPGAPWEPCAGYRDAERAALALAGAVFVGSPAEAQRIRARCGERSFTAYVPAPADVAAPGGAETPYVLSTAPVGPQHASATLARAAARLGFPVRFTGAIVDGAYAARTRSYLDARSSFAPHDPGRGARVVADISWSAAGLSALAAHAAHGVPVVAAERSDAREILGAQGVWTVDPADESAVAAALADAWNGGGTGGALAASVRARCRLDVLRACLAKAYLAPEPVA